MGWSYYNRVAYGVQVTAWDNPEIQVMLKKHADVISYDRDMSSGEDGTIFVYVKSTYQLVNEDHGSYEACRLDTKGDDFTPPLHRCFQKINHIREIPILTSEEQTALVETQTLSNNKCCWVQDARVFH